jgi:hypothetical protein
MKKMKLWVHLLVLTAALLVSATTGGKVDAAQVVNRGEIGPTFAPSEMSTAQGGHPVIFQVAQPSEGLSGRRNRWENLTWDILMWNGLHLGQHHLEETHAGHCQP